MSGAHEYSDILLRSGEKGLYDDIRLNEGIRFPPSSVENVANKVSTILQAELAGLPLHDMLKDTGRRLSVNPKADIYLIMEHAPKMFVECRGRRHSEFADLHYLPPQHSSPSPNC